jgi:thiamine biosynthesis lipoprotein
METGFYAFGTANFIRIEDNMREDEQRMILSDMSRRCDELDDMLSVFKPESDISRINENAGIGPVKISSMTYKILERALYYAEQTDGAFDPTIRPAVELWKIGKAGEHVPSAAECADVSGLVNYRGLHLDVRGQTAFLEMKGQKLDLGGIAKGAAGDEIKAELKYRGVRSAILNFGGTILTIGQKADGRDWKVGIQNPVSDRGRMAGSVTLNDDALVTSGVNERYFIKNGKRFHHLLDPETCMPAESGVLSVTAAGGCAMDLDALTTALFVKGAEKGIELVTELNKNGASVGQDSGLEALYINDGGSIVATRGFADMRYRFTMNSGYPAA